MVRTPTPDFSSVLLFEQDPVQILDALLPLYLNSQILRALQKSLSATYNRQRQAKITGEILERIQETK